MPDYLSCVVPGADQWIDTVYGQMPHPAAYVYVPRGVSGTDTAGCPYDDQALQYCLGSQIVYLGEASVWQQYTTYGDAAAVVVLAHEITHHFQRVLGMPTAQTPNEQIRYENQSDCGAGAFMAYASAAGMVQPDDDIVDLAGSLAAAAEVEGGDRTHGTISQRLESFDRSFLAGQSPPMAMCIPFVPEVPIVG